MTTTSTTRPGATRLQPVARPSWFVEHRPFLVALTLGALVRVLVMVAFTPALIHSDGPQYLSILGDLRPDPDRPVGYVLLLLFPASLVTSDAMLVALLQHVLGMVTAVVLYAMLRRWGVGRWLATAATLPVLLDTLQLNLEHTVLSDTLFELMLVVGLAALCRHRRVDVRHALVAGLVLGAAVTVRVVGEQLVAVAVVFCLVMGGRGWLRRVAVAVALVVGFVLPVGAYATWFHQERGVFALSEFTGKALYLRSTSFVDCSVISVPEYQRVLCPAEPLGQRRDPTYYVFHDPTTLPRLQPPPGTTQDQALRQFAFAAVRAQPVDYAAVVTRDLWMNFDVEREDRYGYDTAHKWNFEHYLTVQPTAWTGPAYAAHGGQLHVRQPFADAVVAYGRFGHLPGPLLLACGLLGLLGGLGVRRSRGSGLWAVTSLMVLSGIGLLVVPDLTAQFTWRYQVPALALLPAAAALGWTALRGVSPATPAPTPRPAPTDRTVASPATPRRG